MKTTEKPRAFPVAQVLTVCAALVTILNGVATWIVHFIPWLHGIHIPPGVFHIQDVALMVILLVLAVIELSHPRQFIVFRPSIRIPLVLLSTWIAVVHQSSEVIWDKLGGAMVLFWCAYLADRLSRRFSATPGIDQITLLSLYIAGLYVGLRDCPWVLLLTCALASCYGVLLILRGEASLSTLVPSVHFIITAAIIVQLPGSQRITARYYRWVSNQGREEQIAAVAEFLGSEDYPSNMSLVVQSIYSNLSLGEEQSQLRARYSGLHPLLKYDVWRSTPAGTNQVFVIGDPEQGIEFHVKPLYYVEAVRTNRITQP